MDDTITSTPCTPQQRHLGWDEAIEYAGRSWPSSWEMRPNDDVYAFGAVHADIVPVYWDTGSERGVDWWWVVHENKTAMGAMIMPAPDCWEMAASIDAMKTQAAAWSWTDEQKERAQRQWDSMEHVTREWAVHPTAGPCVVVPSAHLWGDWGWDLHIPLALKGPAVDEYMSSVRASAPPQAAPRRRHG